MNTKKTKSTFFAIEQAGTVPDLSLGPAYLQTVIVFALSVGEKSLQRQVPQIVGPARRGKIIIGQRNLKESLKAFQKENAALRVALKKSNKEA